MSFSTGKSLWALVPIKGFDRAKSRLSPVLDAPSRAELARSSSSHVLDVLAQSPAIAGVLVIGDGPEVIAYAQARGLDAMLESPGPPGLGRIVDEGLHALAARGVRSTLVLMADLPRLEAEDIAAIAHLLDEHDLVIGPDLRDEGTNALALATPLVAPNCFGNADSFHRHQRTAERLHLRHAVYRSPRTGLDVDEPDDLRRLAALPVR